MRQRYVHCRGDSPSGRVNVLLRLEESELRAELVAAQVFTLRNRRHPCERRGGS